MPKKTIEVDGETYDIRASNFDDRTTFNSPRIKGKHIAQVIFMVVILLGLSLNNLGCFSNKATPSNYSLTMSNTSTTGGEADRAEVIRDRSAPIEHVYESQKLAGFAERMNSPLISIQTLTINDTLHMSTLVFRIEEKTVSGLIKKVERRIRKFAK